MAVEHNVTLTESFVLEEIRRLQFFYGLKREIRYGEQRSDATSPESVAEHIYGMFVLFEYFYLLENPQETWDRDKMRKMIVFHDSEEIITGDTIGYLKTEKNRMEEKDAMDQVLNNAPMRMREELSSILQEYSESKTIEAKFVKAIDKLEPVVHLLNPEGKRLLHQMGTTYAQNESIKLPFFNDFPIIRGFYEHAAHYMRENGYFVVET